MTKPDYTSFRKHCEKKKHCARLGRDGNEFTVYMNIYKLIIIILIFLNVIIAPSKWLGANVVPCFRSNVIT